MADYTRTIGVVIGGYGLDTSKSGGTAWCFGGAPTTSTDYDWREVMTTPPQTVGVDVNPNTGAFAASSFDFELAATDEVAEALFYQQRFTEFTVGAGAGSGVSDTAAQIQIVDAGGSSVTTLGGTVIFVGDEAILLSTYNASLFSSTGGYGCTRGYYSTPAQTHADGQFVYTSPQFIRFRELALVLYDNDAESESIVWRGFVEDLETNDTGASIIVRGIELFGVLQSATVNRGAPNLSDRVRLSKSAVAAGLASGSTGFEWPGSLPDGTTVFKSGEADPFVALQLGDEMLIYGHYDISENDFGGASGGKISSTYPVVPGEIDDVETYEDVYEVFVIDYAEDAARINADGTAQVSMTTAGYSATRELERPFHPLAIALAMLVSTTKTTAVQADYDVLGPRWSLQIDRDLVDITSFETLIDRYPTYRIERMIIGWDGEPVNVWETIREYCLRPFGFYFGTSDDGKLNVSVLPTNLGIGDFYNGTDLEPIPNLLRYQASRQDAVDEVIGVIGATPWTSGNTLTIRGPATANKNSARNRIFAETRTTTYTIPFGEHATIADQAPRAFAFLTARATQGAFATPRIVARFKDPDIDGDSYDLGNIITLVNLDLENAWLVDETGTRIRLDATKNIAAAGPIIGREYDVRTLTYTLTLLLQGAATGELIQWRAPAAVIDTTSSTTSVSVQQNAFHSSAVGNDTDFFTVGDDVIICDADGSFSLGPYSVTAKTSTSLTLSASASVTVGQVVRLADYDGYANTSVISGAGDKVYFYLSRDGSTLGTGNDDPHKYG